jgi:hypothetical protein
VVLKGAGFHFQRMRGLQIFCEKVAGNPYLREDQAWIDFLEEGRPLVVEKEALPMPPKRWMEAVKDLGEPYILHTTYYILHTTYILTNTGGTDPTP